MKYKPYPPTCGVDYADVDETNNQTTLIIIGLAQVNDDRDDLPVSTNTEIVIHTTQLDEILNAIEENGQCRPMRLDPV